MSIIKKIIKIFSIPSPSSGNFYPITVKCNRCGEIIHSMVNMSNDLSIEYGESEQDYSYYCRKGLVGEKYCSQTIEVELSFDRNRRLINRQIKGGTFLEEKAD